LALDLEAICFQGNKGVFKVKWTKLPQTLMALSIGSLLSFDAMAVCVLGIGECSYADCLEERLSGCETRVCAASAYEVCRAKFPSGPSHIGWEIDDDGLGTCFLKWTGSQFSETSIREKPQGFSGIVFMTPRHFSVTFFYPESLMNVESMSDEKAFETLLDLANNPIDLCGQRLY